MFFPGLDDLHHARHFERAFISVNRLRRRRSDFAVADWIMDSGAFTEISTHGYYRTPVADYAAEIERWRTCGNLLCAVAQDMMCEPFIVALTGLDVREHQRITVDRYRRLRTITTAPIMPVLQGFAPAEYVDCIHAYGDDLAPGAWVGVGSVCKRNVHPHQIEEVLFAITDERPDLRLHLFGVKLTALRSSIVRRLAHSADSMAWSDSARKAVGECARRLDREAFACPKELRATPEMKSRRKRTLAQARQITGRDAHDWREAKRFETAIYSQKVNPAQHQMALSI